MAAIVLPQLEMEKAFSRSKFSCGIKFSAPQAVRDLHWASGSIETLRGTVAFSWQRTERSFRLEAEIHLPKLNLSGVVVKESGQMVWKENTYQSGAAGLRGARQTRDAIIFQAGSGRYVFELSGE